MSIKTKGIILAAGRGSRMGKLTLKKPKCLLEINGESLLSYQLKAMKSNNIDEIALITGYQSEQLKHITKKNFHNEKWAITQMVDSLEKADEWLKEYVCIISYSDIFYEPSAIKLLLDSKNKFAITYDPNWFNLWSKRFSNPLEDAETFIFDDKYFLTEIGNKTDNLKKIKGQYMGLLKINPEIWNKIKKIRSFMSNLKKEKQDMTNLLNLLCKQNNIKIKAIPYFGSWGEVDDIHDLNLYSQKN